MDTSYALTTKERMKDRLQITSTAFDDLFDTLVLAVTDRIEQMTNRRLMLATWTNELYDAIDAYGQVRNTLLLKNAPVRLLTSVEYKGGTNSNPTWTEIDEDDYDIDLPSGIIYFNSYLPAGRRNIRVTYSAGYAGYAIGINTYWLFNTTPTGAVNGVNTTFILPEDASQIVVYADGLRIAEANYTFVADTDTFTFDAGFQPYSTIAVDYLPSTSNPGISNPYLPMDLVEVCEEVVTRIFKRRDAEGKSSETFGESSVTWRESVFTKENLATIKNYRRSTFL